MCSCAGGNFQPPLHILFTGGQSIPCCFNKCRQLPQWPVSISIMKISLANYLLWFQPKMVLLCYPISNCHSHVLFQQLLAFQQTRPLRTYDWREKKKRNQHLNEGMLSTSGTLPWPYVPLNRNIHPTILDVDMFSLENLALSSYYNSRKSICMSQLPN